MAFLLSRAGASTRGPAERGWLVVESSGRVTHLARVTARARGVKGSLKRNLSRILSVALDHAGAEIMMLRYSAAR